MEEETRLQSIVFHKTTSPYTKQRDFNVWGFPSEISHPRNPGRFLPKKSEGSPSLIEGTKTVHLCRPPRK